MSTLVLVRHGQARAYEGDSDRLSPLGEVQARRLGDYLVQHGVQADEVHCGTLERQRRTLEIVGEVFRAAGRAWPELGTEAGWNEYDAPGVLGRLLPALAAKSPPFASLVEAFRDGQASSDRNRHFQRMFEMLMAEWERGALEDVDVEPFVAFYERVSSAMTRLTTSGGNRTVFVFTSGGPIGVCVQRVLEAPRSMALKLNWRVKNSSLTEFVFSSGRISLESFNALPHLTRDEHSFR